MTHQNLFNIRRSQFLLFRRFSEMQFVRLWLIKWKAVAIFVGILALLTAFNSRASLVAVTGDVSVIAPPPSVLSGALVSNTTAFVFEEKTNVVYTGFDDLVNSQKAIDLGLNFLKDYYNEESFPGSIHTQTGLVDEIADLNLVRPPIGAQLDSYLLHYQISDGCNDPSCSLNISGTLYFNSEIVGVQVDDPNDGEYIRKLSRILYESDEIIYPNSSDTTYLGLELVPSCCGDGTYDQFKISADRHSLSFSFANIGALDQLRILTRPVPNPIPESGTITLMAIGLGILVWMTGRRKQTTVEA